MLDIEYDFPSKELYIQFPDDAWNKLNKLAKCFNTSQTDIVLTLIMAAKIPEMEESNET